MEVCGESEFRFSLYLDFISFFRDVESKGKKNSSSLEMKALFDVSIVTYFSPRVRLKDGLMRLVTLSPIAGLRPSLVSAGYKLIRKLKPRDFSSVANGFHHLGLIATSNCYQA